MARWPQKLVRYVPFVLFVQSLHATIQYYPTARVSTKWTNNNVSVPSPFGSARIILFNEKRNSRLTQNRSLSSGEYWAGFACGFYSYYEKDNRYYFAVGLPSFSRNETSGGEILNFRVLWVANRNRPVGLNAALHFLPDGNLVLRDEDGTLVWSTNTSHKSVVGMEIMGTGNLVLHDDKNNTVWQSFDHPTDTLLPGQRLMAVQKLVAGASETDVAEGVFSFSLTSQGLFAFYQDEMYFRTEVPGLQYVLLSSDSSTYAYALQILSGDGYKELIKGAFIQETTVYIKFDADGHLRLYSDPSLYPESFDLLSKIDESFSEGDYPESFSECDYPTPCGNYGLCSEGKCQCPTGFFSAATSGCLEINPITCENQQSHFFLPIQDVYYFSYTDPDAAALNGTNMNVCKEVCLNNCSCKAAFFRYEDDISVGNCFLASSVLSLKNELVSSYQSYAFIKISPDNESRTSLAPPPSTFNDGNAGLGESPDKPSKNAKVIAGSIAGALFLVGAMAACWIVSSRKKRDDEMDGMDDYIERLSGMPTRFTFEELKIATGDFQVKLGEGGFGSVFEGSLKTGERIAVKCLDAVGQGKKEFLTEVKTIGSIHHVNLVKLIGFCAQKSHKLLVYEFMCNGSLDKWIFYKEPLRPPLDWQTRRIIIADIAKGLTYLHEDCRQRIIHLDIKPQNILLDASLHAKISDFGLCALIDKDRSQVVTTMRGTPGYLAPEWFNSVITEKVDVYSFGVVVMEMVCGRRNIDRSEPEEYMHLLPMLMRKAMENQLADMVDKNSEDMQLCRLQVVEMMRVAIWCLQSDFTRRPSMSTVVKVLEGTVEMDVELDYNIYNPIPTTTTTAVRRDVEFYSATALAPSILSGPR